MIYMLGVLIRTDQITLDSMSNVSCFEVRYLEDNNQCDQARSMVVQLSWTVEDLSYTLSFHQENITVDIDDGIVFSFSPFFL